MINGKLARLTCALTLAFSTSLFAAQPAVEGQTLKLAIGPEPTEGFDPMLGWSHGSYLLLHAPLLKQNADMSWGNLLTEKVETSADGKTWTLTLKPDLKFSDGSPLTAEDVVFTFNKAATSGGKIDMGNFTHARLKDNRTVEMTLRSPQSTFVNVLGSLGIVPAKQYDEKTFARNPIGAGPYRLVSFQPGQQLIVEANPWYAGKKNDFSRLVFVFLDEDNAYAAARSGQLGLVRIAPSMAVAPQQDNLKLWVRNSVENRGIVFPMVPAGKKDANGYPVGNDITADVAIRRAINYAIDRKQLAEQVMEGHAIPAYSAVQGLPWQGPSVAFKDGDSDKARALLEQAGWKVGPDGVRVKNGKAAHLTLWYASGDSTRRDLAEAVRAMLEPVGIAVSLQSGSWETVERHMHSNPTLFGWGSLDPMELFHHYSGQAAGVEYYNPGYYSNPAVEQHLKQAIDAPDWQKAVPFWQQVEWDGKQGAGVQGDAAWAWLLNIQHTYLANPCIDLGKGAPEIHGSWSVLNNLDEWTLDLPLMKSVVGHFLRLIVLLVLVAAGTFILLSFSPVDPIRAYIGNDLLHVPPEQYARIAARWGLDQPLWERFGHWFARVLQGDLGYSMLFNAPVASVIKERFATSFALLCGAWLMSGLLGTAMGFVAGRFLNRWPDKMICRLSYLLSSLPTFWIGMLLLAVFAVRWPVLPVCCAWEPGNSGDMAGFTERLRHLILPVCALSLLGLGQITLHTRESIASVMKSDFVRFARSQGDKGWSLLRHQVLRHAITPALCLQFASLGELFGGALLAEKVFAYPGLGQATIDAGLRGDVPLLMGIVLFSTVLVFIGNSLSSWLVHVLNRAVERPDAL